MLTIRTRYSPGYCEYQGGYKEVRWDLSGCNLRCHFCWSPASRPAETGDPVRNITTEALAEKTRVALIDAGKSFIRFTGGEPTLQWEELANAIDKIRDILFPVNVPILIQTNGIEIGKGNISLEVFKRDTKQPYLIELSFKGTNSEEFSLLTNCRAELYEYQVRAYELLHSLSTVANNLRVIAVLGVYHSSTQGPSKYAFVNPRTGKLLFDDKNGWDPQFKSLWQTTKWKWVEPLRMSPMGVWKNIIRRCGPDGSKILANFPVGIATNLQGVFPMKPKSFDYARLIVSRSFWH